MIKLSSLAVMTGQTPSCNGMTVVIVFNSAVYVPNYFAVLNLDVRKKQQKKTKKTFY